MQDSDLKKLIAETLREQLAGFAPAKPTPPPPALDDPDVVRYVDHMINQAKAEFNQQLESFRSATPTPVERTDISAVLKLMVPGLANVTDDFRSTKVEGTPFTWSDVYERALQNSDVDALKQYVKAYEASSAQVGGDPRIPSSSARSEAPPPRNQPVAPSDTDLAALLGGKLTLEDYDKRTGVHK